MKLSPQTRYAIRILSELADCTCPLSVAAIAERTGISLRSVENIHAILKQHELTDATVGSKGGVRLAKSLDQISLGQMVGLFENGVEFTVCCGEKSNDCPNQPTCDNRAVWRTVSQRIQNHLDQISLAELLSAFPAVNDGRLPFSRRNSLDSISCAERTGKPMTPDS